jgi:hypothetical protein
VFNDIRDGNVNTMTAPEGFMSWNGVNTNLNDVLV